MTRSTSDHAFFDDTSLYMRLRARFLPGEKLRGYFQWLREQHEQAAAAASRWALAAAGNSVVVRLDDPSRPVTHHLTLPKGATLGARFRAEVSLDDDHDFPPDGSPFRLLLVSPAMLATLRRYLREDESPLVLSLDSEAALRQLLGEDVLRSNLEAARVLSAVPELEGTFNERGYGIAEGEVPFGSDNLPHDVIPVVVYDRSAR
jgi:hypothetical protein